MRSPGTVISGGFPGRVAQEVQPNPKCHGCLHYDGQGGRTGVCTIGTKPFMCGEGDDQMTGYAPIARGAGSYLPDMSNHSVQAREAETQFVSKLYGSGSTKPVQFQTVTLGEERERFVKSLVAQHMEMERRLCRLHQGNGPSFGASPYHHAPQSCSCSPPTDVSIAKALVSQLSNRERVSLDAADLLDFVRAFGDVAWTGEHVQVAEGVEKGTFFTPVGKYETKRVQGGGHHVEFHPHEGEKQHVGTYPSAAHARHALITHARKFAAGSGSSTPVRSVSAGPAEATGKMKKPTAKGGAIVNSMTGSDDVEKAGPGDLKRVHAFVKEHGFHSTLHDDHVKIHIPWTNTHTGEKGTDVMHARTMKEARDHLGY